MRTGVAQKGEWFIRGTVLASGFFWATLAFAQEFSNSINDPTAAADYFAQMAQANQNMTMSIGNINAGGAVSSANIFAGIIFGAIGLGAFIYGKKSTQWRPMVLGVALMALPYFPLPGWAVYLIGAGLIVMLFVWRE